MIRLLTVLLIALIGAVLFVANAGLGGTYFSFIYDLPLGDKIGHFVLMGTLSFMVNMALRARRIRIGRKQVLLGSLLVFVLVTLEEFSQIWLSTRTFSLMDLVFDYAGIWVCGRLAYAYYFYHRPNEHWGD